MHYYQLFYNVIPQGQLPVQTTAIHKSEKEIVRHVIKEKLHAFYKGAPVMLAWPPGEISKEAFDELAGKLQEI